MAEDQQREDTIDFIFEVVKRRLDSQLVALDAIDTKIGSMMGILQALLALVGAAIIGASVRSIELCLWQLGVLFTLLLVSLGAATVGYWYENWRVDPDPRRLYEKYGRRGARETKVTVISNYIASFEANRHMKARKIKYWRSSFGLFGLAMVWALVVVWLHVWR